MRFRACIDEAIRQLNRIEKQCDEHIDENNALGFRIQLHSNLEITKGYIEAAIVALQYLK